MKDICNAVDNGFDVAETFFREFSSAPEEVGAMAVAISYAARLGMSIGIMLREMADEDRLVDDGRAERVSMYASALAYSSSTKALEAVVGGGGGFEEYRSKVLKEIDVIIPLFDVVAEVFGHGGRPSADEAFDIADILDGILKGGEMNGNHQ